MTGFVKSLNSQGDSERLSQELCHQQVARLDSALRQTDSKAPALYHEVILSTSSFQDHAEPGDTRMNKIQTSPSQVHTLRWESARQWPFCHPHPNTSMSWCNKVGGRNTSTHSTDTHHVHPVPLRMGFILYTWRALESELEWGFFKIWFIYV